MDQTANEFEVYLVSNGSMNVYPDNTLAAFSNYFSEPIHLQGEWSVALSEITFPLNIKNITTSLFVGWSQSGVNGGRRIETPEETNNGGEESNEEQQIEYSNLRSLVNEWNEPPVVVERDRRAVNGEEDATIIYDFQPVEEEAATESREREAMDVEEEETVRDEIKVKLYSLQSGIYESVETLLRELQRVSDVEIEEYKLNDKDGKLSLTFQQNQGFAFPTPEIPNILGFEGQRLGYYDDIRFIGHLASEHTTLWGNIRRWFVEDPIVPEPKTFVGDYPVDISAGTNLIFVYLNIIDYQHVANTKSPILRIIDTNRRLKNGRLTFTSIVENKGYTNLQYKKVLLHTLSSIRAELRTETGQLVPFQGTGKVVLTLHFKKLE